MGQFKPMVKMFTDEPSVILKLKKGGKVKAAGQAEGFKSMAHNTTKMFDGAADGAAPKKPSMAERRKAMNPNLYAKGGKVAHKQYGGVMPGSAMSSGAAPMGTPMQPMGRSALANLPPQARAARAAQVRKALTGMKKGGSTADCAKLEKELKHHEAMSASQAHGKASGGNVGKFAKTKVDTAHKDKAHGTGEVKEGKPAGYKMGGSITGNEKAFENTKMVTSKVDRASGTGGVKMSNAGGFKKGGAIKKLAFGGLPSQANPQAALAMANRPAMPVQANNVTYKKGGRVPGLGNAIEGGDWENRPANSAKPGVTNTKTGEVKEANAGGYKKGGATKKAYATGGNVVDDGKAEKMPRRRVSGPVANTMQSGTFKRGGKVKFAEGGEAEDMSKGAYDRSIGPSKEDMDMAKSIRSIPSKIYQGAKSLFGGMTGAEKAPGAVTKTKESVTVAPAKKRGGLAKC